MDKNNSSVSNASINNTIRNMNKVPMLSIKNIVMGSYLFIPWMIILLIAFTIIVI